VGVLVLKECIARAGSLEAGLRYYVGAGSRDSDGGGYVGRVLQEQSQMRRVADGKPAPAAPTAPVKAPAAAAAEPVERVAMLR